MSNEDGLTWAQYVSAVVGEMTADEVAGRVGVSATTIRNWKNPDYQRPIEWQLVHRFADAFGRPRTEALRAAGVLGPDDIVIDDGIPQAVIGLRGLGDAPLDQILDEIRDRVTGDDADHPRIKTRGRRKSRVMYDPAAPPV